MYDVIIRGGTVVDGTGAAGFVADVGIKDGRITKLGDLSSAQANWGIDASGRYVTPGFIDSHSHADCSAPMWPDMESAIGQGITTCVTGHCGMGLAPIHNLWVEMGLEEPAINRILPQYDGGPVPDGVPRVVEIDKFAPVFEEYFHTPLDWRTFDQYLDRLDRGLGPNLVCHVGHQQLRQQVLGTDAARPATKEELEQIATLLRRSLDEGAWGLSFGFDYTPSKEADRSEFLYLMQTVAEYDRVVTAHVHSRAQREGIYHPRFTYGEGLVEFLELGRESGARIHVSHMQPINQTRGDVPGIDFINRKAAETTLELIEHYRAKGVRVTWDYLCGPLIPFYYYPEIAHKFRPYVDDCGGPEAFARALSFGWYKDMLLKEYRNGTWRGQACPFSFKPDRNGSLRCIKAKDATLVGKTLAEIASEQGKDVTEAALDIVSRDPRAMFARDPGKVDDCARAFVGADDMSFGTDNGAYNYDFRQEDGPGLQSHGSPSAFCQMVAYLEADFGLSFEQMIRRLSGNAAISYGLPDRGFIREGYHADLLVIDKANLRSNYNLVEPRTAPSGIEYVLVNGAVALEKGVFTGVRSGRPIRAGHSRA